LYRRDLNNSAFLKYLECYVESKELSYDVARRVISLLATVLEAA
jgi:hypothetical protein